MDITSTAALPTPVAQKPTALKTDKPITPKLPDDANIQAIQKEISQISDEVKNSKLAPLAKDTVDFTKSQEAEIVNMTTPASPLEKAANPAPEPIKENTPAA